MVLHLEDALIAPQYEVFPGVVQSSLGWRGGKAALVSKSGGFGGPETLVGLLGHYGLWA